MTDQMQAERWNRLRDAVADALDQPPPDRASFLRETLGDDPDLVNEAIGLADVGEDAMLHPEVDAFIGLGGPDPSTLVGKSLVDGKYHLVRLVGEGGMASVYEARQVGMDRPVAIKVLRRAAAGYDAPRRFGKEVDALGRLDHPGIATIYEAGHDSELAVAFIAMEFVDGPTVTQYVRAVDLPFRDRLKLVADIADAVQAAHQKGVIHRDLKPDNVLVTADGRPKVLDFGIARLLEDDAAPPETLRTTAGLLLGTLGYMAPEQASGSDDVDIRCDVYALAVLLHELLVGRPPIDVKGVAMPEALRRLAEPNVTPSSIGLIPGDDTGGDVNIVLSRALEAEPNRRYATAEAFASDLRRLLAQEPILARPPTLAYQVRKFARRNKPLIAATAAIAVTLVVATAVSSFAFVLEASARAEAERNLEFAEASSERQQAARLFLRQTLEFGDANDAGAGVTVLEALRQSAPLIPVFADGRPVIEADLRTDLARNLRSVGELDAADEQYALAEQALLRSDDITPASLADHRAEWVGTLADNGEFERARALYEQHRSEWDAERDPDHPQTARIDVQFDATLASVLHAEGKYEEASAQWREVLRGVDPLIIVEENASAPDLSRITVEQADTWLNNAADSYRNAGELQLALSAMRRVLANRTERDGANHPSVVMARGNLGGLLVDLGELEDAEATLRETLDQAVDTFGPDSHIVRSMRRSLVNLLVERRGEATLVEAVELAEQNVAEELSAMQRGAGDPDALLLDQNNIAVAMAYQQKHAEAVVAFDEAISYREQFLPDDHPIALSIRASRATSLSEIGRIDEAIADLREVLRIQIDQVGANTPPPVITRNNLAMIALEAGDGEQAARELRACLDVAEAGGWAGMVPILRRNYGRALSAAGRHDEAIAQLTQAVAEAEPMGEDAVARSQMFLDEAVTAASRD
ncbi:MAG: tetratricopeptide repeat protein [Planctomycetota bacterium]